MITSKLTNKSQTTIPQPVRAEFGAATLEGQKAKSHHRQ
jgi:bifunctional DNA-binding transcriptional regulator/antitoxin component of YhaV-PrlF toxin-antitoxin module